MTPGPGRLPRGRGRTLAAACAALLPWPACAGAAAGTLWHDAFIREAVHGLRVSELSGAPTRVLNRVETGVPVPDGSHYLTWEYERREDVSTLSLFTRAGALLRRVRLDGYVRRVRPSPLRVDEVLVLWSPTAGGVESVRREWRLLDLAAASLVARYPGVDAAADWLPDGRVLHLAADGAIRIGTPALDVRPAGRLAVAGRVVGRLWVDRAGARMITSWQQRWPDGGVRSTDLWISALDGRGVQRLTDTGRTSSAVWSPDGQAFAFDVDPASVCTTTGCSGGVSGGCDLYWAPATVRGVTPSSAGVQRFKVTERDGRRGTLGCDLLGWTP